MLPAHCPPGVTPAPSIDPSVIVSPVGFLNKPKNKVGGRGVQASMENFLMFRCIEDTKTPDQFSIRMRKWNEKLPPPPGSHQHPSCCCVIRDIIPWL